MENIRQTLDFWRFDEMLFCFTGIQSTTQRLREAKVEFVGIGKRENFEEHSEREFQVFRDFLEVPSL